MTNIFQPWSANFLVQLANSATRALVLAGGAGLALTACRVRTTSTRLFSWKAVLCSALAMPLLAWFLPPIPIPIPSVLSIGSHPVTISHSAIEPNALGARSFNLSSANAHAIPKHPHMRNQHEVLAVPISDGSHQTTSSLHWTAIAAALYFGVAALFLLRMLVGLLFGRRVIREAKEICEPRVRMPLARHVRLFGLPSIPHCAESESIAVPVTMEVLRPTILLPTNWREWDDAKIDAVLAHELSHVARRDALTQHLSLLHRAIFWFSPLAWWLDRHLAELSEQASDEAALASGVDWSDYAKALLGFFETLHTAPGRVRWQGVAMAKGGQAERRLERILNWSNKKGVANMGLKKSAVMITIALVVPVVFLAASVQPRANRPSNDFQQTQVAPTPEKPSAVQPSQSPLPPESPLQPMIAPTQGTNATPRAAAISKDGLTSVLPGAATAPIEPMSRLTPARAWSGQSGKSGDSYAYGYDDDDRFVIVSGNRGSVTMSGSSQDARHVERLRKQIPGDFIWFQRDEKSYIIRDQATVNRARSFWAPQEELGKKQEALGKQQEALGKQQEALGHRMEQVRVDVPDVTAALDKLKAELKALGPTATQEQLGNIQSEIGELQSKIGDVQSNAGNQQSKEMSALGEQQSKLGEQQDELGRQQEEVAHEASQKMKTLLDESIKNGKAQPERQMSDGGTI